jgi:hypothetical protein
VASVDITPSPRVLRMLGQIDFAPWQCLAELIDNSIDAFIDQRNAGRPAINPRIYIRLPTEAQLRSNSGEIVVEDTAGGMNPEQMKNAVRAGYSGNDPVEKMGLFGMGFNISTARMGRRTEVWTTRADDAEWTGITIDFGALEKEGTFHVPLEYREKTPSELASKVHGTRIHIQKLEADRVRPLIRGAGKKRTKDRLGKIYGRIMSALGISINYDGDVVPAYKHCVWDSTRSVETQAFGRVPAVITIDEKLDDRQFCTTCWLWLLESERECSSCGHDSNVITRPRHLKGWIGIQRYFDKSSFGIDLVRNGRVIEELDKSFFRYSDESGESLEEYPIDAIHWGGRIVGELDIDFVRVSHQKDAFDKLDPEWKRVVEIVRGSSPLQPKVAERMLLGKNNSPLARLFAGYRKGTAGLKDLVPGTKEGTGLNSGPVKEYVARFYAGDPEYQSDSKWYELVLDAERGKRGESSGADEAAGDFPIARPVSSDPAPKVGVREPQPKSSDAAEPDNELSGTYVVDQLSSDITIKVAAFRHKQDIEGAPFNVKPEGYSFRFDYNPRSPFFEEALDTPADFLVVDLAQHFLSLSGESVRAMPVSRIARYLRERYFPKDNGALQSSAATAEALINEIRRHYDDCLPEAAPIEESSLGTQELAHVRHSALKSEGLDPDTVMPLIREGRFCRFTSMPFIVELVRRWPGLSMDGRFFDRPFTTLPTEMRSLTVDELVNCLQDVIWLSSDGVSAISKDIGWRLRYSRALASLKLLSYWRT